MSDIRTRRILEQTNNQKNIIQKLNELLIFQIIMTSFSQSIDGDQTFNTPDNISNNPGFSNETMNVSNPTGA